MPRTSAAPSSFRRMLPTQAWVQFSPWRKEGKSTRSCTSVGSSYLLGRTFTLVTDHAPLQWMARAKDTNAHITRWFLALQDFHFMLQHRAGTAHGNADGFSRMWAGWSGLSNNTSLPPPRSPLSLRRCSRSTRMALFLGGGVASRPMWYQRRLENSASTAITVECVLITDT